MTHLAKVWQIVAVLLLCAGLVGLTLVVRAWQRPTAYITIAPLPTEPTQVTVYVGGAVVHPGLYTLPTGERVEGAIIAAGGLTSEANPDSLNRAQRLRDEAQIVVPKKGEPTATPGQLGGGTPVAGSVPAKSTAPAKAGSVIRVNTAAAAELVQLPGVGPKLAQAIIEYREQHGPFQHPHDLASVQGISDRMVATWADLLSFDP